MLEKNGGGQVEWGDPTTAEREADLILRECQIVPQTDREREYASNAIARACQSYHNRERLKRAPLSRQVMVQAKVLMDAISILQTILPGSRWGRQRRTEARNKHLPDRDTRKQSEIFTESCRYNVAMLEYWRTSLKFAADRRAEVIGGFPFCRAPEIFQSGGEEHTDWRGDDWLAHLAEQLDILSAMVVEEHSRADWRRELLQADDINSEDPLRLAEPLQQKSRDESTTTANVAFNNLIVDLEILWRSVCGASPSLSPLDSNDYESRLGAGEKLPEGQRFMHLIIRACRSVGIKNNNRALFQRTYNLRRRLFDRPAEDAERGQQ